MPIPVARPTDPCQAARAAVDRCWALLATTKVGPLGRAELIAALAGTRPSSS